MTQMASHPESVAYITIGANINDPLANCEKSVVAIGDMTGCRVTGQSRWYRTAPVGFTHPEWFINGAIRVQTTLTPLDLLEKLLAIETAMGRVRSKNGYGPRPLDLDLVLYDDRIQTSARLTLPHPRMHKRRFVLQPICDIDPVVIHPILGATAQDLLAAVCDPDQTIIPV